MVFVDLFSKENLDVDDSLSRILHLVAVRLLLLLGGQEDERDGAPLLTLLHRLRGRQSGHAPSLRVHFHIQVILSLTFTVCVRNTDYAI
jgi:hypothetical protein